MFQGRIRIISTVLHSWGEDGKERYYYDNWGRYLSEADRAVYKHHYGFIPEDRGRGIRVFFDNEGFLQIRNCDIQSIRDRIEKGMAGFYDWAVEVAKGKEISPLPIGLFAIGCSEEIGEKIYRLKSKEKTVNVGYDVLHGIRDLSADYFPKADILDFETGSKDLDEVLRQLFYEKGLQWKDYIPMHEYIYGLYNPKKKDFEGSSLSGLL